MVATRPLSGALTRPPIARVPVPGHQGLQIFGGRMAVQGAGNATYELAMELPARNAAAVGALGVIAAQSAAATSPGSLSVAATLRLGAGLSDLDGAFSGATQTFGGQQSTGARIVVPPPLAGTAPFQVQRRAYLVGDMVETVPPMKTDGRPLPLAVARMSAGSANTAMLGQSGDDFTPWATRAAGLVRFRQNATAGDQRAATAGWSAVSTGPMVGFCYAHAGPILNVVTLGDSQSESRSEDYLNLNWVQRACEALNAGAPKTWLSHSNLAWTGQTSDCFVQHLVDLIASGIVPDIVVLQVGTVNDTAGNVALTAPVVNAWRARFARLLALCSQNRICPLVWTLPPANYVARQYGASDALRVAYNAEMLALCGAAGIACLDAAALVSGGLDANGQGTILPAFNLDNIHLNAAGQSALAAAAAPLLQQLLAGYL